MNTYQEILDPKSHLFQFEEVQVNTPTTGHITTAVVVERPIRLHAHMRFIKSRVRRLSCFLGQIEPLHARISDLWIQRGEVLDQVIGLEPLFD